jgi:hypothetical protein
MRFLVGVLNAFLRRWTIIIRSNLNGIRVKPWRDYVQ